MIYTDAYVIIRLVEGTQAVRAPIEARLQPLRDRRIPRHVPFEPAGMPLQTPAPGRGPSQPPCAFVTPVRGCTVRSSGPSTST
jgi:hypothetical protein